MSMNRFCFSRCTGYPFSDDCPAVFPDPSGGYIVKLRNGVMSRRLNAQVAVRKVVEALPEGCGPAVDGTAENLLKG